MVFLFFHAVLVFFSTFYLTTCLGQLVIFLSNQRLMGSYGIRQEGLAFKDIAEWNEDELLYVLTRLFRDMLYMLIFMLQHSVMASACWKQLLHFFCINVSQRLIYVVATCFTLNNMVGHWESTPDAYLWMLDTRHSQVLYCFFFVVHALAWIILFLQAAVMDPMELIGVSQVYNYHQGLRPPLCCLHPQLQAFYENMRHAGPTCLWVVLWVHPTMTLDRLLAAGFFMVYMGLAYQMTCTDYQFANAYFLYSKTHICTCGAPPSTPSSPNRKKKCNIQKCTCY